MASIACTTWDGGGNVAVVRALVARLRARGHDVALRVDWSRPPLTDADVVLVDHMMPLDALRTVLACGRPAATIVHTLWSFVPSLDGTFAPHGYVDVLAGFRRHLVASIPQLDGTPADDAVTHIGPVFDPPTPGDGADDRSDDSSEHDSSEHAYGPRVVVSLGTTDMGELPVIQRVLDGLADLPVRVTATAGSHIDRTAVRVPPNATLSGFVDHRRALPGAAAFVGHGGHGGIMSALAAGVPIVSIPLGRDQPLNAARVAATGAGVTVEHDTDAATIASTVAAVIDDADARASAGRLAVAIDDLDGRPVRSVEALIA